MDNKEAIEILSELGGSKLRAGGRSTGKSQMWLSFIEAITKAIVALDMRTPKLLSYDGYHYKCPFCDTEMLGGAERTSVGICR